MGVISSKNVNAIIRKSLNMVDDRIMEHGEIVGYILYRMLSFQNKYSLQELLDYTMLGILHDIGIYKDNADEIINFETKNVWKHSIYGYLFLKYLSPMGDKAEIVLYHHLDYNKYPMINSKYMDIVECLNFADKMDVYLRMHHAGFDQNFLLRERNIKFSGRAQELFLRAERKYNMLESIRSGSYRDELNEILGKKLFTEDYKRGFLQMLIYTIDFRSEFTVLHTLATTTFAMELGRFMRLPSKDIYKLYYGALLHDIGKMITPVEILEAPRRLNDQEMEIMKAHVKNTETILRGVVNDDVLEIAVRHHEKLDGTGYYRGLTGVQLTLPQRIVAVADIISALYQKRSYKDSYDSDMIKRILKMDADRNKICPDVVDCALRNYNTMMKNFEQKKEVTMGTYMEILRQYEEIYERFKEFEP